MYLLTVSNNKHKWMHRYLLVCFLATVMGILNMSSVFPLLAFLLFIDGLRADNSACALVDCGQGTCKPSNTNLLFPFECECDPGWKKIQIGPLAFPSCVVPNCTLDFSCGGSVPPSPPPPLPPIPSLPNFTDPCGLTWCGDGTCVPNGTGYFCKCSEGSANLLNMTGLACFRECSLGADCIGIVFGPESPPPPSALPPPIPSAASPNNGPGEVPNSSMTLHAMTILLSLAAAAFSLF